LNFVLRLHWNLHHCVVGRKIKLYKPYKIKCDNDGGHAVYKSDYRFFITELPIGDTFHQLSSDSGCKFYPLLLNLSVMAIK